MAKCRCVQELEKIILLVGFHAVISKRTGHVVYRRTNKEQHRKDTQSAVVIKPRSVGRIFKRDQTEDSWHLELNLDQT